jgi:hypothetical protein
MYNLNTKPKQVFKYWKSFIIEAAKRAIMPHIQIKDLSAQIPLSLFAAFFILKFKGLEAVIEDMYSIYFVILSFAVLIGGKFFWNLLKIPVEFAQEVQNSESAIELISELSGLIRDGKRLFNGLNFDIKNINLNSYEEWRKKCEVVLNKFHLKQYLDIFNGVENCDVITILQASKMIGNNELFSSNLVPTDEEIRRKEFWKNDIIKKFDEEINILSYTEDHFLPFTVALRKGK